MQNLIEEEVERRLRERDSDNAPPQYIPQQTTVFDQDANCGLLAAETFYEMLLQKNFEGAFQWLKRRVDQNVEIDRFLTHKDEAEKNVAHLLANAVQPELAAFIDEHAHDTWVRLVNKQTLLARTPGGWTPLHSLADTPHKGIPQSRISHMVHCVVYPCVWETLVKQNNKGHTFLHMAGLRGNEFFVKYSLDAMGDLWRDDQIKSLLNMLNNKSQSVADASVHNTIIKNMILSKEGEHYLQAPPSWRFNSWIPMDHRWNRKIHRVRLFSKTAFGQDVATQVKIRQNVATTTIMAMGEDGATKVEPAIRGFGERPNRRAHRALGGTSTTASREEVTSHMDHPTMSHDMRRLAKVRVHAPAAK